MTTVEAIAKILHDNLPYQTYVATGRHLDLAKQIAADSGLVTQEDHHAAVTKETDWQAHWVDKWQATENQRARLQRLLNLTSLERVGAVSRLIQDGALRRSKTAKHDAECWQRHTGCLAARISDLLEGREVSL